MRWVVLSDIHLSFKNYDTSVLRKELIITLENEAKKVPFSFVLITGDIMFKYNDNDCKNFIFDIMKACNIGTHQLFLAPGNHDIHRNDEERNRIIDFTRSSENDSFPDFNDSKMGYDRFNNLYFKVKGEDYQHFTCYSSDANSKDKFRIFNIDTCLLSKDDNDRQNLRVCSSYLFDLSEKCKNDDYLNIVIMHHGVQWLTPRDKQKLKHWFADNFIDIVFCGHEHAAGEISLEVGSKYLKQFTCGSCVFNNNETVPSFYICNNEQILNNSHIFIKLFTFNQNDHWDINLNIHRNFPAGIYDYIIPKRLENNQRETSSKLDNSYLKVTKTYKNLKAAKDDIVEDIKESNFFKFYGLRGATFVGGDEVNNIVDALKKTKSIKFLISYPFSDKVRHRLNSVHGDKECESEWRSVLLKAEELKNEYNRNPNAQVRFHETPLIFRLLITEKYLYMSYYEVKKDSSESPMYKFASDTSTYITYHAFFDYIWTPSKKYLPKKIPTEYSFLNGKFKVTPSLVINICSTCNMDCQYCPDGGEGLIRVKDEYCCSLVDLQRVVKAFHQHVQHDKEKSILRITGGEPLFKDENRKRTISILKAAKDYNKLILCTNGVYFEQSYKEDPKIWEAIKNKLLLKISLDTLDKEIFQDITKQDEFDNVIHNIEFASNHGFRIELNMVATKMNVKSSDDILKMFDFACRQRLIGVKVLTVNDFGGHVSAEQTPSEQKHISKVLQDTINVMQTRGCEEREIYLNDDKGIKMKRFVEVSSLDVKCTLTIVDHNNSSNSITPRRTFSEFCKNCKYYPSSKKEENGLKPCATGIMSLTLRPDGLLSPCRLREEIGENICGYSDKKMRQIIWKALQNFDCCFHKSI